MTNKESPMSKNILPKNTLARTAFSALLMTCALALPATAQTQSDDLDNLFAMLKDAGADEVASAPSLDGFSERLAEAARLNDDLAGGFNENGEPTDSDWRALQLLLDADSYSEAKLLATVAYEVRSPVPSTVPRELSEIHPDGNWEFEGVSPTFPTFVGDGLRARREGRDRIVDLMEDRDFDVYAGAVASLFEKQRAEAAGVRGLIYDGRDDLQIATLEDGQIWRRKKDSTWQPSTVERREPSAGDEGTTAPELLYGPAPTKILLGSDNRSLRSAWNGFSMGSHVWEPKGAMISINSSPEADPINVGCTGVKISHRLVITAGHCIYKDGVVNSLRRWVPGADGIADSMGLTSDPSPNGYKASWARYVRGQWFNHEWTNYDFGLFVLYNNSSSCNLHSHGWWKTNLLNKRVHLYGYPDENQNCAASPRADSDCHASMYGDDGVISYAGSYRVRYPIDTTGGQSGTGFYRIVDGKRYVVGAHRGGVTSTRNDGVRINSGNRNMIEDVSATHPATACN